MPRHPCRATLRNFLWKLTGKMPDASDTTSIEHLPLTVTVRTPQCGRTVWGKIIKIPPWNPLRHRVQHLARRSAVFFWERVEPRNHCGISELQFLIPSGKLTYGKSPFLMGKSTISMAIFNSYVKLPEGIDQSSVYIVYGPFSITFYSYVRLC